MKIINKQTALSIFLVSTLFAANTYAHELVLTIDKIKQPKGTMMIALYNSDESYKSNTTIFAGQKVAVSAKTLTVNFVDVPTGDYAIKLYQDENNNGQMDKNLIGTPAEAYGFSNNGGAMGQPDFSEAQFAVKSNTKINIHLR